MSHIRENEKGDFLFRWPPGLRRGSAVAGLLGLWVLIPPGPWLSVCCECCVLSGRCLCVGLIAFPESVSNESKRKNTKSIIALTYTVHCGKFVTFIIRPMHTLCSLNIIRPMHPLYNLNIIRPMHPLYNLNIIRPMYPLYNLNKIVFLKSPD
jgi:hypothetical protein